ncbi:hypothetical protein QM467_13655 [Rhodoblastus sp. 17X3]|uniref:hypothetical protein n=1 Tax=Rhodoblastus sp. 17X3 TaxID=3047026 RepID=UPI0024B7B42B|nr:hypothetical protein [Rhodoblastus sp. 17X3]MDI9849101.1 hypothetical protein [Rhodoblastus sp. 17X3]
MRAKVLVASLLLASALAAPLATPVAAKPVHDGQWRVDIQTSVGNCPPGGQVVVTIKDERVTAIDAGGVEPWGYIDDTNTFVGHFNIGEKVVRANGDVKGQTASGPWSSNTDYCGGRWTARKID